MDNKVILTLWRYMSKAMCTLTMFLNIRALDDIPGEYSN